MSMEEVVRKRHEFEQDIDKYLVRCRTLETRDMEICMAKFYDLLAETTDEAEKLDRLFKGQLLKFAYDKRQAGEKQSSWRFLWVSATYVELKKWKFPYPVPLTEELVNEWGRGGPQSVRKLLPAPD